MPTNTAIGTVSTGNVGTVAWANSVANLNTAIGLYAAGAAFVGSAVPPTNAPNYLVQTGYVAPSFTGGVGTFSFPTTFPNGLLSVQMTPYTGAVAVTLSAASGTSVSKVNVYCYTSSTNPWSGYTGSGVGIFWTAVGY